MRAVFTRITLLLLLGAPLLADEVWSWHTFDYTLVNGERLQAVLHGRVHIDQGDFRQGRFGPVVRYNLPKAATLIFGYYFGEDYDPHGDWVRSHRVWIGAETGLVNKRWARITARSMLERFLVYDRADYFRQRNRIRYTTSHRVAPVLSTELFFDAHGYLTSRHSAGVRFQLPHKDSLEIGYIYDWRRANTGEPRHIFTTHYVFGK